MKIAQKLNLAKNLGLKPLRGSIYTTKNGEKRVILTHREGTWFGLTYGTWNLIKKDESSEVLLVGPKRTTVLNRAALEILVPISSKSKSHYNLNLTKDGGIKTTKGVFRLTVS